MYLEGTVIQLGEIKEGERNGNKWKIQSVWLKVIEHGAFDDGDAEAPVEVTLSKKYVGTLRLGEYVILRCYWKDASFKRSENGEQVTRSRIMCSKQFKIYNADKELAYAEWLEKKKSEEMSAQLGTAASKKEQKEEVKEININDLTF